MQKSDANKLARSLRSSARHENVQMRLADVRAADSARFFHVSAKNAAFSTPKFEKFDATNAKFRRSKIFPRIFKASARRHKTSTISKCKLLGCATPDARDQRILRRKLKRFRPRKFEKSTPQMQKIGCRQVCAHFEKQRTRMKCSNAIG